MDFAIETSNKGTAPAAYGSRDELLGLANRIKAMIPGAHLKPYQENDPEAKRNLQDALWRAAQLCVFYRLMPGEDIHILPFGNSFSVDLGIETWKKAADRYAEQHGITYHIHHEPLTAEEVRDRVGEHYTPEDVGFRGYLWRSDKQQMYDIFGPRESMTKGYGVWRKHAQQKKDGTWQPDQVQAHRTKEDVARRRASKMALRLEFSLDALLAAHPGEVDQNRRELEAELDYIEQEAQVIPPKHEAELDEDGVFVAVGK